MLYNNILLFFYLLLRPLQNIQRFSAVKTWKWILSCQNKSKQRIATNFHVTFRFFNCRMTFSRNFLALGSIVTAIILELIYLWRNCIWKWLRSKEATLHTFDRFKRILTKVERSESLPTLVRVFGKSLSSG